MLSLYLKMRFLKFEQERNLRHLEILLLIKRLARVIHLKLSNIVLLEH